MIVSVVSGGFDPIHSGHVAMIEEAARIGPVLVLINSDEWLTRKKGRPFMPFLDRMAVVSAMRGVIGASMASDDDGTVCQSLRNLRLLLPPHAHIVFCNGGDRTESTTPEQLVCQELGIEVRFGVGGGKSQSSSWMLNAEFNAGVEAAAKFLEGQTALVRASVHAAMVRSTVPRK